jgi:hypothetical protein
LRIILITKANQPAKIPAGSQSSGKYLLSNEFAG